MLQALNPKRSTVLIVEDNPDDAFIETKALQTFGIKAIYHANTAEDAIAFLKRETCDAALIDYTLPGINGLQLVERVREMQPDLRIILVTGAGSERVATDAMKLGAADYVPKDELLTSGIIRALQAALRGRVADDEEQQRTLLSAGGKRADVAREEADWLTQTMDTGTIHRGPAGDGTRLDVLNTFRRYLEASFQQFPKTAQGEEQAIVRVLLNRGASPVEVLSVYRGALDSVAVDKGEFPFSPTLCLARVLAGIVVAYQLEQSMDHAKRAA